MKNFCLPKNKYTYWGFDVLFFALGCICCYFLRLELDFSPILSSAIVGLAGSLIYYKYQDIQMAIYAGTFAGMSSMLLVTGLLEMLILGIIGGSVLSLSRGLGQGLGGKLGASAFISGLALFALKRIFL